MFFMEWHLFITLNLLAYVIPWPTVTFKIIKYNYHIFEEDRMGFNITDETEGQVMYYDVKRDLMIWVNLAIHFENSQHDFSIEFMNKTINVCKMFSSRRYEPIIGIFYYALQERTPTLPKRCPIKKKLFSLPFINFETDKLPPIWPENLIRFSSKQFTHEKGIIKPLLNLTLYVKIQRK